jgi:PAS domain S-box-containing protein
MYEKSFYLRYAIALLAMTLCLLIRWPLRLLIDDSFPYLLLYLGIMVSSFRGGLGPGLFATALGGAMIVTSPLDLLPPFAVHQNTDVAGLLVFLFIGTVTSVLNEDIQRYRRRLQAARVRVQESEALYETTLASLGDGVMVVDAVERIVFLNPAAESLTGWGNDAVGRDYTEVFVVREVAARAAIEHALVTALGEGSVQRLAGPTTIVSRRGVLVPIDVSAAPVRDRQRTVRGAVLVFHDVTRQQQAEEAVREADRRKDEFLTMLGHEMRNPLGPMRNGVQILRLRGDDPATRTYVVDLMDRLTLQLSRLIDDLLDAAHIARGRVKLHCERLDLTQLVQETVESRRAVLEKGGLLLTVEVPSGRVWVSGDPSRLRQVLGQLLSNAAKYTDSGGSIQVRLVEHVRQALVTIRDTGVGIEATLLPQLFEAFNQAVPGPERSKGGLGLGLVIVKGLIEMHGGQVSVVSDGLGKGAEFRFLLPLLAGPESNR